MEIVAVSAANHSYRILLDADWVGMLGKHVRESTEANRVLVISNSRIAQLHGDGVLSSLRNAGLGTEILEVPEGEAHKTISTVEGIWDHLVSEGYTRQCALIALGGGIVGDMTGFAAATYMRGIDFMQVPTTLLAMVDASVGGKTAVNHPRAKNMIGSFWPPRLVFMDVSFLQSLPTDEFRAGFAEVIKHGVIRDKDYFEFLENSLDAIFQMDEKSLIHTVKRSCEIKAKVVSEDERENDLRAILNFGHTLGHAIEAVGQYENSRHGEAVSIGMVGAAEIAVRMGICAQEAADRLYSLIRQSGLPTRFPDLPVTAIMDKIKSDKKVKNGKARFILPTGIGDVVIRDDVPGDLIISVIEGMKG